LRTPDLIVDRIASVRRDYIECRICARDCGVDRSRDIESSSGLCRLGHGARVYKEVLSVGEEIAVGPTHLVDLAGCSMRCLFCTEWPAITRPHTQGRVLEGAWLARRWALRASQGARSVSFVGGEPSVNLLAILEATAHLPCDVPIVWNTNLLVPPSTVDRLDALVDTWLADLKFGTDACARRLSGVNDYVHVVRTALHRAASQRARVIVRHLVMPGHVACCTIPTLRWLRRELPSALPNLMTQYLPDGAATAPRLRVAELRGLASEEEIREARHTIGALRFDAAMVDGVWI